MKATLDYTPAYCPNCGRPLNLTGWARDDYLAGNPIYCECQFALIYASPAQAARSIQTLTYDFAGDLARAEPDPARWPTWLILLAESLEAEAEKRNLDPTGARSVELALKDLREAIGHRLDKGRW